MRKYFILFLLLGLCGCNQYQKKFGGTAHIYQDAITTPSLHTNSKKFPLTKNDRFSIPNIPGNWTTPIENVSPPDYVNQLD